MIVDYKELIGKKVWKNPKTTSKFSPKPFKSGLRINTVKDVVISPYSGKEAFTFEEDDSIVNCATCSIAPFVEMDTSLHQLKNKIT